MAAFILTLDSLATHFTIRARNEAKRSSVKLRSLVEGVPHFWSTTLVGSQSPLPLTFAIRHHHLFHFGRRTSWIRFEPSLRETLVDSNHRCRASIRTLSGPFWARCKLGFDHKPRFITTVTNLGFVGCCYLFRGLYRPRTRTQSPEQGGGCRRLPNFPDSSRFLRHQLISAPLLLAFYRNLSASSSVGFEGVLPAGAHPGR